MAEWKINDLLAGGAQAHGGELGASSSPLPRFATRESTVHAHAHAHATLHIFLRCGRIRQIRSLSKLRTARRFSVLNAAFHSWFCCELSCQSCQREISFGKMLHCKVTLSCGTLGLGIEQLRAVESSSYCRRRSWKVRCSNSTAQQTTVVKEDGKRSKQARVLVLGGTGRVGGSTARALAATDPAVQIVLAGRNR